MKLETKLINRPRIVCLCGSTKFKKEFEKVAEQLTIEGKIFLTVGVFGHSPDCRVQFNDELKQKLDKLHLAKIDLSDEVFVINSDGYIGESTKREIEYAIANNKPVTYLNRPQ